jgi:hypothetical protein
MSPEAGRAILLDYRAMETKDLVPPNLSSTWYKDQIVAIPQENVDNDKESTSAKRKKTPQPMKNTSNNSKQKDQSNIHHAQTQQANKALSAAASTEENKKIAVLAATRWFNGNDNTSR